MISKKQNLFGGVLHVLFLLNLWMSIYCLFAPSVRGESYLDDSRYLVIHKEQLNLSKYNQYGGSKELAVEIAGGCTLNMASVLICVNALANGGDSPAMEGIIVATALAPLISSLEVTGVGHLVGDEGSWAGALTGAFATVLPGIFVFESRMKHDPEDAVFLGASIIHTFSPVGAAIGYRLGRPLAKYKCLNYVLGIGVIAYLSYVSVVIF